MSTRYGLQLLVELRLTCPCYQLPATSYQLPPLAIDPSAITYHLILLSFLPCHRLRFRSMNCRVTVRLDCADEEAWPLLRQVRGWFQEWEAVLSRFNPESELSRLNNRPQEWVETGEVLWDVLQVGLAAAELTDGLVTPAILPALEKSGYDRSFELLTPDDSDPGKTDEAKPEIAEDPIGSSWRNIQSNPDGRKVCLPPGLRLDLGGFGKGWAVDQACWRLAETGPALVEAGGDIAVSGIRSGAVSGVRSGAVSGVRSGAVSGIRSGAVSGVRSESASVITAENDRVNRSVSRPWKVGIADPFHPGHHLFVLDLTEQAGVAASGSLYRRWGKGGILRHHLIDPRTGQPSESDLIQVTVVAGSTVQAEVAAKAAFLLGSVEGAGWLSTRGLRGVLVCQSSEIIRVGL